MAMWDNWCFSQFYHSRIEVFLNCLAFVSVSLLRGNLKELKRIFKLADRMRTMRTNKILKTEIHGVFFSV